MEIDETVDKFKYSPHSDYGLFSEKYVKDVRLIIKRKFHTGLARGKNQRVPQNLENPKNGRTLEQG